MSDDIYLTREFFHKLHDEFERLKKDSLKISKEIEAARLQGDLSENAEYDAAKERQQFINGRIGELGYKLGNADIIDPDKLPRDRVVFGSRVLLENTETGEGVRYQLVGPDESNIEEGRISVSSPLGQAIIGKRPDDEITIQAPAGKRVYELVEIL